MKRNTLDSLYTPTFAPLAQDDKTAHLAQQDFSTRLGFQATACAIDEKAGQCDLELTRRHVHSVHREVECLRFEQNRLAPAAFAGAAAAVAGQLVGCASQSSMLQQQQLSADIVNAQAVAGTNGLTNFQLTAFQLRTLQIGQNRDATIAGVEAAASNMAQWVALYGWGTGYGAGYGARGYGYGDGSVLPAATAAGGCCGR